MLTSLNINTTEAIKNISPFVSAKISKDLRHPLWYDIVGTSLSWKDSGILIRDKLNRDISKIVYQLVAKGQNKLGSYQKISSKKIFKNRLYAENYINIFKKLVCNSPDGFVESMFDLEPESVAIKIIELELEEYV